MIDYLTQLERDRRRRTLRKLARNCGSVKQARPRVLITVLSPENRIIYQRALLNNTVVPVLVGARLPEETQPPVSPFSKGELKSPLRRGVDAQRTGCV